MGTVVAAGVGLVAAVLLRSEDTRQTLRGNYCALRDDWAGVLEAVAKVAPERRDILLQSDGVRALFHTGRLPTDLFQITRTSETRLRAAPNPDRTQGVRTLLRTGRHESGRTCGYGGAGARVS